MIEELGLNKLKALIEDVYGKKFTPGGELQLLHTEFEEFEPLNNNNYAFCYQTDFARLSPKEMRKISDYANTHNAEIRLGIDQNIYIIGVDEKVAPFDSPALSSTSLPVQETFVLMRFGALKMRVQSICRWKKSMKHKIKVGFSGCAKGCGRHRHTDIGLIGLKTNNFGDTDGGARIFIGAEHDNGKSVARQLFSMVPFVHLKEVVNLIIALFEQSKYKNFQLYAHHILNKYSENFLSLWHLYNLKNKTSLMLPKQESSFTCNEEKKPAF